MKLPETITKDTSLFIDECEPIPSSIDNRSSSSSSEKISTKTIKAIGNNKSSDEKHSVKRASWSPAENQECGLPPTGKRIDGDHSTNSNRVRMRSRSSRNYQLQKPHQISLVRPISFNERYERLSNQSMVRN